MLEEADADVLLLLDCCHSAASTMSSSFRATTGIKEVIAACGYETTAPGVGPHSFTKALAEILATASKEGPISVGELHSRVLAQLKCWVPSLYYDEEGRFEEGPNGRLVCDRKYRPTPVYSIISESQPRRSIVLHVASPPAPSPSTTQCTPPDSALSDMDIDEDKASEPKRKRDKRNAVASA